MSPGPTSQPGSAHRGTGIGNGTIPNTSQLSPHNPNSASSSSIEDFTPSSRSPSLSPGSTPGSTSTAPPSPVDPISHIDPSSSPSSIKRAKQKIKTKKIKRKQKGYQPNSSPSSLAPSIELSDFSTLDTSTSPASPSGQPQAASSPDGSTLCPPSPAALSPTTSAPLSTASASTTDQRLLRSSTWQSIRSVVPTPTRPSANNSLAFITLAVSAFGLLFFGYRAYKMQIMETMHAYVQNCLSLQQQQHGHMSKRCKILVDKFQGGKLEPPYPPPKRDLSGQVKRWIKRAFTLAGTAIQARHQAKSTAGMMETESSYDWLLRHKATLGPILVTSILLLLGTVLVMRHLQHSTRREAPPFQSPARSEPQDIRLTRSFDTGEHEEIMQEPGWLVIPHDPDEHSYLGRLRRMLRDTVEGHFDNDDEEAKAEGESEIHDSESQESMSEMLNTWFGKSKLAETLTMGDERHGSDSTGRSSGRSSGSQTKNGFPTNVHLHHRRSVSGPASGDEEVRANLIELPARGMTKNFFDPNTGEFIHLIPWSSQNHTGFYVDDGESSDDEEDMGKGETKQKFVQMTTGGAALAGGKHIDALFLKEMERLGAAAVASGEETRHNVMSMLVGDCFGGLVTRWKRRAMPQMS
ncbi:MAG: hypothetical protein OHK93_008796 [Ramalina farinacea]|uniref:Uncharacterized protein n=1 Tax=Ramalina farinacea TaxID=258253 RepID=A0AA43QP53_9LECA|nr:hypothetical protein [Ramalina farinacea]